MFSLLLAVIPATSIGSELIMIVLTALITTLITGTASMLGFWFLYAKDLVSRTEVEKIMKEQSPYLNDKPLIFNRLDNRDKIINDMSNTIHEIVRLIQDLRVDVKELSVRINMKDEKK